MNAPTYTRPSRVSPLVAFKPKIQALLELYPNLSGVRIRELLEPEGYRGSQTILNDFLHELQGSRRAFPVYQRTAYAPGAFAQIDWVVMSDRCHTRASCVASTRS